MKNDAQILLLSDRLSSPGNQAIVQALEVLGDISLTDEDNLFRALREHPYILLLLDASILKGRIDTLIREVKSQFPDIFIVLLTVSPHWRVAKATILAGAEYIEKSQDPNIMAQRFKSIIDAIQSRKGSKPGFKNSAEDKDA